MIELDNLLDYLLQITNEELSDMGVKVIAVSAKGPRSNRILVYKRPVAYALGFGEFRIPASVSVPAPGSRYHGVHVRDLSDHELIKNSIRARLSGLFKR